MEMISYIAAQDLTEHEQLALLAGALDTAVAREIPVIVLGTRLDTGAPVVCTCGCAWGAVGALVLLPDVVVLEGMAHGHSADDDAVIKRADGRSGVVLKMLPDSAPPL